MCCNSVTSIKHQREVDIKGKSWFYLFGVFFLLLGVEPWTFHVLDKPSPTISCSLTGFYVVDISNVQLGEEKHSAGSKVCFLIAAEKWRVRRHLTSMIGHHIPAFQKLKCSHLEEGGIFLSHNSYLFLEKFSQWLISVERGWPTTHKVLVGCMRGCMN